MVEYKLSEHKFNSGNEALAHFEAGLSVLGVNLSGYDKSGIQAQAKKDGATDTWFAIVGNSTKGEGLQILTENFAVAKTNTQNADTIMAKVNMCDALIGYKTGRVFLKKDANGNWIRPISNMTQEDQDLLIAGGRGKHETHVVLFPGSIQRYKQEKDGKVSEYYGTFSLARAWSQGRPLLGLRYAVLNEATGKLERVKCKYLAGPAGEDVWTQVISCNVPAPLFVKKRESHRVEVVSGDMVSTAIVLEDL
jgi:hypothetical protein